MGHDPNTYSDNDEDADEEWEEDGPEAEEDDSEEEKGMRERREEAKRVGIVQVAIVRRPRGEREIIRSPPRSEPSSSAEKKS